MRRRKTQPWRAWYNTKAWKSARELQLSIEPLCERCKVRGDVVSATVVNHRKRHRGDWDLFIDPDNHESTCQPCHDGEIKREEMAADKAASKGGVGPISTG